MTIDGEETTRTMVTITKKTLRRLKQGAADSEVSLASYIRQTLEERASRVQPMPKSGGTGHSGRSDVSQLASDFELELDSWR